MNPPKLHPGQKVVCICRNGQVRSVAARNILADHFGFRKVLTCGWEKNDEETVKILCDWADVVIVVGRGKSWLLPTPSDKTVFLNVGHDTWGAYDNPDLQGALMHLIKELM